VQADEQAHPDQQVQFRNATSATIAHGQLAKHAAAIFSQLAARIVLRAMVTQKIATSATEQVQELPRRVRHRQRQELPRRVRHRQRQELPHRVGSLPRSPRRPSARPQRVVERAAAEAVAEGAVLKLHLQTLIQVQVQPPKCNLPAAVPRGPPVVELHRPRSDGMDRWRPLCSKQRLGRALAAEVARG